MWWPGWCFPPSGGTRRWPSLRAAGPPCPCWGSGTCWQGVKTAIEEEGAIGILTGGLTAAAAGITTSLVCGVVCSWVGKSHDQN